MANAGPGTNGSQFLITHKEHTMAERSAYHFGHLVSGQDVVNAIQQDDTIVKVKLSGKGKPAKKFKADKVFEELRNK